MGARVAMAGAAGAGEGAAERGAEISRATIRPCGPEPLSVARSSFLSRASRRAKGEAKILPFSFCVAVFAALSDAAAAGAAGFCGASAFSGAAWGAALACGVDGAAVLMADASSPSPRTVSYTHLTLPTIYSV